MYMYKPGGGGGGVYPMYRYNSPPPFYSERIRTVARFNFIYTTSGGGLAVIAQRTHGDFPSSSPADRK